MKKSDIKLQITTFDFLVNNIYHRVSWIENPNTDNSIRKYRVGISCDRGNITLGVFYTDLYINKSNSADLLLKCLKEQ